jgi:hypothetical protein
MTRSKAILSALVITLAVGSTTAHSPAAESSRRIAAVKAVASGHLLQVPWGGWRGGWGGWGYRPWAFGPRGWGAAGAVIGGALISVPYYAPYPYYGAYYAPAPYYDAYAYGAYAGCYPYGPYACVEY